MTMQPWFPAAKLGIFIHWGIYAVDGVAESWSFFNGTVDHGTYMRQLDGFTARSFDAAAWAELFRDAQADYAVLTTKHHDGVALWDTLAWKLPGGAPSTVRDTPAARDLVVEYVDAMRAAGLHVGLYFSHLDWTHPDYASIRPTGMDPAERGNPFAVAAAGDEDPEAWERFLAFHRWQLGELVDRFHPDLLWFDGDWERTAEQWWMADVRAFLDDRAPQAVLNGRMTGGFGDYATPEQGVPIVPPAGPWELCLTLNDSWGWQGADTNYKSLREIVRIFAETIGGGGNLLLDVGPREDGSIPQVEQDLLRGLGDWIRRHDGAVHGTGRGLPPGHFYGASTLSDDRTRLYLFLFDIPRDEVVLRGISVGVRRARLLGTDVELEHRRVGGLGELAGWEYIAIDGEALGDRLDPLCAVIEVELDGELTLATEHTRD
jgi:Alpha-L-fucosidase